MPPEISEKAFACVEEFPDEATYFVHAVAYSYPDAFIEEHFYRLIAFEHIDPYQINKLFLRKATLSSTDWKWLEDNYPDSMLYIAAQRGRVLSDEECAQFSGSGKKIIEYRNRGTKWAKLKCQMA
jgi:hypothetical protein